MNSKVKILFGLTLLLLLISIFVNGYFYLKINNKAQLQLLNDEKLVETCNDIFFPASEKKVEMIEPVNQSLNLEMKRIDDAVKVIDLENDPEKKEQLVKALNDSLLTE